MTANEIVKISTTRKFQSIDLIKWSIIGTISGILLAELIFWILIFASAFFLQSFNDGFSDFGSMFLGIVLGFYLKPIISGIFTFISFSMLLRRSKKAITNKNLLIKTSLLYAVSTIVAISISIVLSAIETNIPLTNLFDIYLLFIR